MLPILLWGFGWGWHCYPRLSNQAFSHTTLGDICKSKSRFQLVCVDFEYGVWVGVCVYSGVTLFEGARGQGMAGCPID